MNDLTVHELRDLAKAQGPRCCYKLRKTGLNALLSEQSIQKMPSEQSTQEMLTPPLGTKKYNRKFLYKSLLNSAWL